MISEIFEKIEKFRRRDVKNHFECMLKVQKYSTKLGGYVGKKKLNRTTRRNENIEGR